jgi:hypothetical protein
VLHGDAVSGTIGERRSMHRVLEIILGLERGFLSREGELSLQFNPHWPGSSMSGRCRGTAAGRILAVCWFGTCIAARAKQAVRIGWGSCAVSAGVSARAAEPAGADAGQSRTEPSVSRS